MSVYRNASLSIWEVDLHKIYRKMGYSPFVHSPFPLKFSSYWVPCSFLGTRRFSMGSEQIDGEVLIELDEQILESDLQISSKIHRIRLMKLICRNYSAED